MTPQIPSWQQHEADLDHALNRKAGGRLLVPILYLAAVFFSGVALLVLSVVGALHLPFIIQVIAGIAYNAVAIFHAARTFAAGAGENEDDGLAAARTMADSRGIRLSSLPTMAGFLPLAGMAWWFLHGTGLHAALAIVLPAALLAAVWSIAVLGPYMARNRVLPVHDLFDDNCEGEGQH